MCLVNLFDRIGQLTPTPVLDSMDGTLRVFNMFPVALDHRANVFTLIWMNEKNNLVMSHRTLPVD